MAAIWSIEELNQVEHEEDCDNHARRSADISNQVRRPLGVAYSLHFNNSPFHRNESGKRFSLLCAVVALALALLGPSRARAESARGFWPEIEGYFGLSDDTRLVL